MLELVMKAIKFYETDKTAKFIYNHYKLSLLMIFKYLQIFIASIHTFRNTYLFLVHKITLDIFSIHAFVYADC